MNDHPSILLFIMSWIGPAISAVGGLFNSLLGSHSNANLNAENRYWQAAQNTLSYERQKELTMLSPQLEKQGLQYAGISTAAMNGYTGGSASVSASNSAPAPLSEYVPFDVNSLIGALSASATIDATKANTKKTIEEAEAQKLENEKTINEMQTWNDATSESYYLDDSNNKHFITDKDFDLWAHDYVNTHGSLPDLVKTGGALSENAAKVMSSLSNFKATIAQSGMYEAQALLAKKVAELKLADSNVMKAIYKLDEATYNHLMVQIDKVRSDIDVNETIKALNSAKTAESRQSILESVARTALIKTQDKSLRNSSVNNLIDQLGGDKSTQDNLITVGKIILSLIAGFTHASI